MKERRQIYDQVTELTQIIRSGKWLPSSLRPVPRLDDLPLDNSVEQLWATARPVAPRASVIPRPPPRPWQPVHRWGRPRHNHMGSDQGERRVLHNPQALSLRLFEEDQSLV